MSERRAFAAEAPFEGVAEHGVVDGRPLLREWISEQIFLAIAQAEMAWRALEIADDHGARYHVRRVAAHVRQVVDGANDLKTVKVTSTTASEAA
jgi:hypothetical protein